MRAKDVKDATTLRSHREAVRVFFSRPGPKTIAGIAATLWGARALLGPPGPGDLVGAAAAVAVWPIQEWVAHKYLLHLEPRTIAGKKLDPAFARIHREHHAEPRDIDTLMLPMGVILGSLPLAGGAWLLLLGPSRAALTAMATYSTMALVYEWTHFIVHSNVKPRTAYGRAVRRNHRLHHFRHEQHWFGFTFPAVDRWFGTDPDPDTIEKSPTAMDLHGLFAAEAAELQRSHA